MANGGFWIFEEDTDVYNRLSEEENDKMKIKGKSFYAFRWFDSGDFVYLQEMTTEVTVEKGDVYGDGEFNALVYTYPNSGHAMTAVEYKVKNGEMLANEGRFKPALVKVTTDINGEITEVKELEYLSQGIYLADDQ